MIAAKGFFAVTAGIIPEQPMQDYSRQWAYSSRDHAEDKKRGLDENTIFAQQRDAALEYARDVINPSAVNWVRLDFIWV